MSQKKLFLYLSAAAGYVGIGLVLGYTFSDQVRNTPLWVGGLLVLLGAVLLGMSISNRTSSIKNENVDPAPVTPVHDVSDRLSK